MTEGISGTNYGLYQQPVEEFNKAYPDDSHSWDTEVDRLRAQDEAPDRQYARAARVVALAAEDARLMALAQDEVGGEMDLETLDRHDRESLLVKMKLYGVPAGIKHFLEQRAAAYHVDEMMADFQAGLAKKGAKP